MHRTQIILEDWQYQVLRAQAEQEGRSMSELVREILRAALSQPSRRENRLGEIDGVGEDAATYGRDHDQYLYGKNEG
jgi:plasmid stability protein